MASEDGDDEYEVEMILAERYNLDHVRQSGQEGRKEYLVKWDGYPDEQCTWEPYENFNSREILNQWMKQKAEGNTLLDWELKALQDKMDAWQAKQDGDADADTEEADTISVHSIRSRKSEDSSPEPARKKSKLVHDGPLISNKGKVKQGIARRASRNPRLSLRHADKAQVSPRLDGPGADERLKSKPKKVTIDGPERSASNTKKAAAPPLHGPTTKTPPNSRPSATKTNAQPVAHTRSSVVASEGEPPITRPPAIPKTTATMTSIEAQPQFIAPDLSQRAKNTVNGKNTARTATTGKKFRNLQHLNNARKRMAASMPIPVIPQPPTIQPPATTIPPVPSADSPMFFEEDAESLNASPTTGNSALGLFFSSSEDELLASKRKKSQDQSQTEETAGKAEEAGKEASTKLPEPLGPASHVARNSTADQQQNPAAARSVRDEDHRNLGTTDASSVALAKLQLATTTSSATRATKADAVNATAQPSSRLVRSVSPERQHDMSRTPTVTPRQRRSSLFNQRLPPGLQSPGGRSLDGTVSALPLVRTSPHTQPQQRTTTEPRPHPKSTDIPAALLGRSLNYDGNPMNSTFNGYTRTWLKGDCAIHPVLHGNEVGAAKIIHASWEYCKLLVELKPKESRLLPIEFSQTISRNEYDVLSNEMWYSYLDVGSLEPFPDTVDMMESLAGYLETNDQAALWEHPDKNLMLVLYSSRAPSWQTFGTKAGRDYPSRLHIAFRQKFRTALGSLLGKLRGSRIKDSAVVEPHYDRRETIESRDDARRASRRDSVASLPNRPTKSAHMQSPVVTYEVVPDPRKNRTASTIPTATAPVTVSSSVMQLPKEVETSMSSSAAASTLKDPISQSTQVEQAALRLPAQTSVSVEKPTILEASKSIGFGYTIAEIASTTKLAADSKNTSVCLLYKDVGASTIQKLKDTLIRAGLPWDQIHDGNDSKDLRKFRSNLKDKTHACVVFFDKWYPFNTFTGLSKNICDYDNFVCWEVDMNTTNSTFPMRPLFNRGMALTIAEACFVNEPENALLILKWYKGYISRPFSSSAMMVPPNITKTLLTQESLSTSPKSKELFNRLALLVEDLISIAQPSLFDICSDSGRGSPNDSSPFKFTIIKPAWHSVYGDMPQDGQLTPYDQRLRDEKKEERLFSYYAAWALRYTGDYRKFIAIRFTNKRLLNTEHVRYQNATDFMTHLNLESGGTSTAKDRGRPQEKDGGERGRSRDGRNTDGKERQRSRSRGVLTPGQSPAFSV